MTSMCTEWTRLKIGYFLVTGQQARAKETLRNHIDTIVRRSLKTKAYHDNSTVSTK